MNKTKNYQLSQWEKSDRLMMEDFNSDNAKIDAALAALQTGKANAGDLTASTSTLQTQIDGKIGMVVGSYKGNDAASRTINLGFQPKAVYLCMDSGMTALYTGAYRMHGGLAFPGLPVVDSVSGATTTVGMQITSNGFTVYQDNDCKYTNSRYHTYYYFALR